MPTFVPVEISWTDNSSGDQAETGTEVQIYTDSPSFVPNIPVNPLECPHAWMSLPTALAGVTSYKLPLQIPFTFVVVRTRQYNANGNGSWDVDVGTRFNVDPVALGNTPPAPSAVGFAVSGTSTPPSPGPTPPTPTPPGGGGGTASNYVQATQFSGTAGDQYWSYLDTDGNALTYDAGNAVWEHASQAFLTIWSGGIHPGTTKGAVQRWTVPANGQVAFTGTTGLFNNALGGGVTVTIKHNSTTKYTSGALTTASEPSFSVAAFAVSANDTIDFICEPNTTNNGNCSTRLNLNISYTSDGTAPVAPVLSSITSAVSVTVGGVASAVVSLSSAALSAQTISLSSADTSKATVPASVIIPLGSRTANVSITGVATGSSDITATLGAVSKVCAATVSAAVSSAWANEPSGFTTLFDTPFSGSLPANLIKDYNTEAYTTDATAPLSPSQIFDTYLAAGASEGNGQWSAAIPNAKQVFLGTWWKTNAAFQGLANLTNKMLFLRQEGLDNSFLGWRGFQDQPKTLVWGNQTSYSNAQASGWQGDADGRSGWLWPNTAGGAAATMAAGSGWHKIEIYIKCSTTTSAADGIFRLWVDNVLTHNVTNFNQSPSGITQFVITHTWDGSSNLVAPARDMSREWHHYWDHMKISYSTSL